MIIFLKYLLLIRFLRSNHSIVLQYFICCVAILLLITNTFMNYFWLSHLQYLLSNAHLFWEQ